MHNNTPIVPYISLCSGYEGIGLGLHRCIPNLPCIAYCEREAFAVSNVVAKMEKGLLDAAPVFTDVTTFPWEQFAPYMAGGILSFGWPCQPVSMAGKRKATEDERWLFDIIADGISILKPGMLFAENVEGLLSAKMPDGSLVFSHCIERLERLHYKVEAGIFSASEVGAPHQRKRVFIMAHNNSERIKEFSGRIAVQSLSTTIGDCCIDTWPSRPGEPQYAWEPHRVTGAIPRKLADTNNAGWEARGHNAISIQGRQPHELAAREGDKEPAGLEDSNSSRGEEPKHQHTNLPSEPSKGNTEAVGNSSSLGSYRGGKDSPGFQSEVFGKGYEAVGNTDYWRLASGINAGGGAEADRGGQGDFEQADCGTMGNSSQREDLGRESRDLGQEAGEGRCGDHAADCTGEVLGNSSNWRGGESRDEACEGQGCRTARSGWSNEEQRKIECEVGRNADEPSVGVDISELSGLSHSELAEIREWMVKTDNRTDELRLLGNGVVPATATRAFLTLLEKITK